MKTHRVAKIVDLGRQVLLGIGLSGAMVTGNFPASAAQPPAAQPPADQAAAPVEKGGQPETKPLKIADGQWQLSLPAKWEVGRPRVAIIEHEVKVPRSEGDTADGRLTMMAAGGSAEANIERWVGQFRDPAGPQIDTVQVAGTDVRLVDLKGTFIDRPGGPAGPTTERPKYRMLGAIIPLGDKGHYFLKLSGPEKTIADNLAAFQAAVRSLSKP